MNVIQKVMKLDRLTTNNEQISRYLTKHENFSDLLDDDIKDDIKCAKEVFNRSGLKSWKGWQNKCKSTKNTEPNKALPNLTNCAY